MRLIWATALISGVIMSEALAAPFCLVIPGGGRECMYYDGAQCAKDANRATGGACEPNMAEVHMRPTSGGDYCVMTGHGASVCGYSDPSSCATEALRQKGACLRAPTAGIAQLPQYYAPNVSR